jgi:hypothetical protein
MGVQLDSVAQQEEHNMGLVMLDDWFLRHTVLREF